MANDSETSPPPAEVEVALPTNDGAPAVADGVGPEDSEEALRKRLLAEAEGLGSDNEVYEFSEGETDSEDDEGSEPEGPGLAYLYRDEADALGDGADDDDSDDDEYTDEQHLTGPDAGQYDADAGQEADEDLDGAEKRDLPPAGDALATTNDDDDDARSKVDPGGEEEGRPAKRVKVAA